MTVDEVLTQNRIFNLCYHFLRRDAMPKYVCAKCGRKYIDSALEGLVVCPWCDEPIRRTNENQSL
jgi:rubrerythrin